MGESVAEHREIICFLASKILFIKFFFVCLFVHPLHNKASNKNFSLPHQLLRFLILYFYKVKRPYMDHLCPFIHHPQKRNKMSEELVVEQNENRRSSPGSYQKKDLNLLTKKLLLMKGRSSSQVSI